MHHLSSPILAGPLCMCSFSIKFPYLLSLIRFIDRVISKVLINLCGYGLGKAYAKLWPSDYRLLLQTGVKSTWGTPTR